MLQLTIQWAAMAYKLACVIAAMYYTILSTERYLRNEDKSVISFRSFNQRPEDRYPDLTFCVEGGHLNDAVHEFVESEAEFGNILKGKLNFDMITNSTFQKIANMNSEVYFTNLSKILQSFSSRTNQDVTSYKKSQNNFIPVSQIVKQIFYTSHQDPDQNCFTRNSDSEKSNGIIRIEDKFSLNLNEIPKVEMKLKVYLHYPGQFFHTIRSPAIEVNGRSQMEINGRKQHQ